MGASFTDVLLPNIFGEHGVPFYNSVVATFCHQLANGGSPQIHVDRELPLLHAQRAASLLLDAVTDPFNGQLAPTATLIAVTDLLDKLRGISGPYVEGSLPDLSDPFVR
jgi:UDP-2-acetamido-2,6-beta-L-arabino-hexul-4-ose reductase